ncbi:MAG: PaaI family thioesterase [Candidatus Melainabacteria bacterium]
MATMIQSTIQTPSPLQQALLERIFSIPAVRQFGIVIDHLDNAECTARAPYIKEYTGSYQSFHGGMLAALADTIACFAVMTRTAPDEILTTTDLHIRYLAACLSDVTVKAKAIKVGRTLCPVQVELFDENGTMVAIAQVTYMRLPGLPNRA